MLKSALELINSSENELNSEIIFIFHFHPNAHLKNKILNGMKEGQRKVYKKCILLKKIIKKQKES